MKTPDFYVNVKGIVKKDSNKDYHGNSEYIGSTSLKKYKQSPLHFKEEPPMENDAFAFGSTYHCYILEPELFEKEYFVFDDKVIIDLLKGEGSKNPRATKGYKEWHEQQMILAGNRIMIDNPTMEMLINMKNRLFKHPYARYLLTGGQNELSHYLDDYNGVKVKVRTDGIIHKKRIICDLKTTQDASLEKFQRSLIDYGYHFSGAYYSDIIEQMYSPGLSWKFYIVAQEKKAPYAFNIFKLSSQALGVGQYEYEQCLRQHKYCLDTGEYRGYDVFADNKYGIQELSVPAYGIKELNFYNKYES